MVYAEDFLIKRIILNLIFLNKLQTQVTNLSECLKHKLIFSSKSTFLYDLRFVHLLATKILPKFHPSIILKFTKIDNSYYILILNSGRIYAKFLSNKAKIAKCFINQEYSLCL